MDVKNVFQIITDQILENRPQKTKKYTSFVGITLSQLPRQDIGG